MIVKQSAHNDGMIWSVSGSMTLTKTERTASCMNTLPVIVGNLWLKNLGEAYPRREFYD